MNKYQVKQINNQWEVGKLYFYEWRTHSVYATEQEAISVCEELNKQYRR